MYTQFIAGEPTKVPAKGAANDVREWSKPGLAKQASLVKPRTLRVRQFVRFDWCIKKKSHIVQSVVERHKILLLYITALPLVMASVHNVYESIKNTKSS